MMPCIFGASLSVLPSSLLSHFLYQAGYQEEVNSTNLVLHKVSSYSKEGFFLLLLLPLLLLAVSGPGFVQSASRWSRFEQTFFYIKLPLIEIPNQYLLVPWRQAGCLYGCVTYVELSDSLTMFVELPALTGGGGLCLGGPLNGRGK